MFCKSCRTHIDILLTVCQDRGLVLTMGINYAGFNRKLAMDTIKRGFIQTILSLARERSITDLSTDTDLNYLSTTLGYELFLIERGLWELL